MVLALEPLFYTLSSMPSARAKQSQIGNLGGNYQHHRRLEGSIPHLVLEASYPGVYWASWISKFAPLLNPTAANRDG